MPEHLQLLGEHEARIKGLERDVHEIKSDVKQLLNMAETGRGGWFIIRLGGAILLGGIMVYFFMVDRILPLVHTVLPR